MSNSTPATPPVGRRTRPRYPQELGRVPLHRRGTSKTYERLEDLLREAGYKETRIFTPETERRKKDDDDDDDDDATVVENKRTSMVKDVVGFLSGLIPSSSLSTSRRPEIVIHPAPTSGSPSPSRATAYLRHIASAPNMKTPQRPNSSPADLMHHFHHPPRPKSKLTVVTLNESDSEETLHPPSSSSTRQTPPPLPKSWLEMVANAVLFGGVEGAHVGRPLEEVHHHRKQSRKPPSLSQTSRKSRPSHYQPNTPLSLSDSTNLNVTSPSSTTTTTTATPSSGFLTPVPPPPPALFERGRPSLGCCQVSLTRVTCRSAPGSRSGSVVRPLKDGKENLKKERRRGPGVEGEWDMDLGMGTDMYMCSTDNSERERRRRERGRNRGVKRRGGGWLSGGAEKDKELRVPSLARTHVEGDVWSSVKNNNTTTTTKMRRRKVGKGKTGYSSEGATGGGYEQVFESDEEEDQGEDENDDDDDDEEEEEGELTLARILIPPKRQNSIRSLRKHLMKGSFSSSSFEPGGFTVGQKNTRIRHGMNNNNNHNGYQPQEEEVGKLGPAPPQQQQQPPPNPLLLRGFMTDDDESCLEEEEQQQQEGSFWSDRSRGRNNRDWKMGSAGRSSLRSEDNNKRRVGVGNVWGVV